MYKQYFRNDYCGNVARPNQSLKLTEPAVDDLARAKQVATIGRGSPRADWIRADAISAVSLAPVR